MKEGEGDATSKGARKVRRGVIKPVAGSYDEIGFKVPPGLIHLGLPQVSPSWLRAQLGAGQSISSSSMGGRAPVSGRSMFAVTSSKSSTPTGSSSSPGDVRLVDEFLALGEGAFVLRPELGAVTCVPFQMRRAAALLQLDLQCLLGSVRSNREYDIRLWTGRPPEPGLTTSLAR